MEEFCRGRRRRTNWKQGYFDYDDGSALSFVSAKQVEL